MKKQKFLLLISIVLLLCAEQLIADQSEWFQRNNWNAFISQTAIYSNDYNFLSQSDDTVSFDLWEAGFLVSSAVKDKLTFSAQVLGRKVSDTSGNDLRVDYAFLSYPFYQTMSKTLGVRIGRIRSSYGLYNETRDIPHTRTGIVMPQSIYFDMTRNSFYSADGLEFFGYRDMGDQRLSAQIFFSKPVADEDETGEVAALDPKNLKGDKSLLAKISFGSDYDGFRTSFTYYRPEYTGDVSFPIGSIEFTDDNASLYSESMVTSLEYNQLDWSLTTEYLRHKIQITIPGLSGLPGQVAKSAGYEEAYYIQGIYRISEQWESYVRYDSSERRANRTLLRHEKWKDINIGSSFRPNEHWLLRAEVHYIEGISRLLSRDNETSQSRDPYWTAVMFQIAYKW